MDKKRIIKTLNDYVVSRHIDRNNPIKGVSGLQFIRVGAGVHRTGQFSGGDEEYYLNINTQRVLFEGGTEPEYSEWVVFGLTYDQYSGINLDIPYEKLTPLVDVPVLAGMRLYTHGGRTLPLEGARVIVSGNPADGSYDEFVIAIPQQTLGHFGEIKHGMLTIIKNSGSLITKYGYEAGDANEEFMLIDGFCVLNPTHAVKVAASSVHSIYGTGIHSVYIPYVPDLKFRAVNHALKLILLIPHSVSNNNILQPHNHSYFVMVSGIPNRGVFGINVDAMLREHQLALTAQDIAFPMTVVSTALTRVAKTFNVLVSQLTFKGITILVDEYASGNPTMSESNGLIDLAILLADERKDQLKGVGDCDPRWKAATLYDANYVRFLDMVPNIPKERSSIAEFLDFLDYPTIVSILSGRFLYRKAHGSECSFNIPILLKPNEHDIVLSVNYTTVDRNDFSYTRLGDTFTIDISNVAEDEDLLTIELIPSVSSAGTLALYRDQNYPVAERLIPITHQDYKLHKFSKLGELHVWTDITDKACDYINTGYVNQLPCLRIKDEHDSIIFGVSFGMGGTTYRSVVSGSTLDPILLGDFVSRCVENWGITYSIIHETFPPSRIGDIVMVDDFDEVTPNWEDSYRVNLLLSSTPHPRCFYECGVTVTNTSRLKVDLKDTIVSEGSAPMFIEFSYAKQQNDGAETQSFNLSTRDYHMKPFDHIINSNYDSRMTISSELRDDYRAHMINKIVLCGDSIGEDDIAYDIDWESTGDNRFTIQLPSGDYSNTFEFKFPMSDGYRGRLAKIRIFTFEEQHELYNSIKQLPLANDSNTILSIAGYRFTPHRDYKLITKNTLESSQSAIEFLNTPSVSDGDVIQCHTFRDVHYASVLRTVDNVKEYSAINNTMDMVSALGEGCRFDFTETELYVGAPVNTYHKILFNPDNTTQVTIYPDALSDHVEFFIDLARSTPLSSVILHTTGGFSDVIVVAFDHDNDLIGISNPKTVISGNAEFEFFQPNAYGEASAVAYSGKISRIGIVNADASAVKLNRIEFKLKLINPTLVEGNTLRIIDGKVVPISYVPSTFPYTEYIRIGFNPAVHELFEPYFMDDTIAMMSGLE